MRIPILLLVVLAAAIALVPAADQVKPKTGTVDKLRIDNRGGVEFSMSRIEYRDQVKVLESDLYLECEKLTLLLQTNSPSRPTAGTTSVSGGTITNLGVQLETIIAETNLLVMARGMTLLGDRAVYTRSNETFVVTGDLVVVERSNFIFFSTNFVYNRVTGSGYAVGWTATEIEVSGLSGTNGSRPGFGIGRGLGTPGQSKPQPQPQK